MQPAAYRTKHCIAYSLPRPGSGHALFTAIQGDCGLDSALTVSRCLSGAGGHEAHSPSRLSLRLSCTDHNKGRCVGCKVTSSAFTSPSGPFLGIRCWCIVFKPSWAWLMYAAEYEPGASLDGRYEILDLIGRGASGVTYKVSQRPLCCRAVLIVFVPSSTSHCTVSRRVELVRTTWWPSRCYLCAAVGAGSRYGFTMAASAVSAVYRGVKLDSHRDMSHGTSQQMAMLNDPDDVQIELFEREAQALKGLSHPNIPNYIEYFEVDTPNDRLFCLVQVCQETERQARGRG